MISKHEEQARDELFRLMRENPDLPVVPIVNAEICGDDSGYWCGAWGHASVDEYLICKRYDYMAFKSWDDVFDVLEKYLSDEEFENLPESESECRKHYDETTVDKGNYCLCHRSGLRRDDGTYIEPELW